MTPCRVVDTRWAGAVRKVDLTTTMRCPLLFILIVILGVPLVAQTQLPLRFDRHAHPGQRSVT